MLPHRHTALFNALYASPHGGPIRTLPLILESGTIYYELKIPCFALFDRLSNPTLTTTSMTRAEWNILHTFTQDDGVLKVILSPDDGVTNFLGKLTVVRGEADRVEKGSVCVRFWWQEKKIDGVALGATITKGLDWVKGKVGS